MDGWMDGWIDIRETNKRILSKHDVENGVAMAKNYTLNAKLSKVLFSNKT